MKKLKPFLGLFLILVLTTGLISTYGCSALSQSATSPQPVAEMMVTQPVSETPVAQPATVAPEIVPTTTAAPEIPPPTTLPPVIATPPPADNSNTTEKSILTPAAQESLLAEIRSKAEQPSPGIYYIDAATAKMLVDSTLAIIMDARYLVDYELLHLAGAISLPVSSVWKGYIDPTAILPDKDAILIAYCAPGCPAGLELAAELAARGYHNLFVLIGGYYYWQEAGYPMEIKS